MGSYYRNRYVRILTTGNFVLSASPAFTGTITASKITSSSSLSLDSNGGASVVVGANSPKQTGQFNTFIVLNNSTDLNPLFAVQTAGTSSGSNDIFINAPLYLNGAGTGTAGYYLVSGGASSPPTWVSTGGGTFNPAAPGPIGGTTPSTAAFTNISVNRSAGNPYIFWTEGTHYGTTGLATSAGSFFTDSAVADMCIRSDSGRVLMGPGTGSTASTAIVGTNGASNALTVNGGSIASTKQSTGFLTPSGQGAYMGWNRSSTGVTCFYNQLGGGTGGWEWVGYNSSNVSTGVCMTLSQSTSALSVSGGISSGGVISNNAFSVNGSGVMIIGGGVGTGGFTAGAGSSGTSPPSYIGISSASIGTGNGALNFGVGTVNTNQWCTFYNSSSAAIGSIFQNGVGGTTFSTTSDYRAKTNIQEVNNEEMLKNIMKLKIVDYNYITHKDCELKDIGVLAHELNDVFPHLVSGEKDSIDENGNPIYQTVDLMRFTPILVSCVQHQQTVIEKHDTLLSNMEDGKITAKTLHLEMENDRLKSDLNVANQRIDELESKVETLIALYMKEFHFKKPSFIKTKKQFPH